LTWSNVVREARNVARVTHEDRSCNLRLSSRGDRNGGVRDPFVGVPSTTVSIVKDLTTLEKIQREKILDTALIQKRDAYLRIANQDKNSAGTSLVERIDLARNGRNSLLDRVGVAHATAWRLTTASRVVDGLGSRAWVRAKDRVHDGACCAVTGRDGGLTSTEDVNLRARALTLLNDATRDDGRAKKEKRCDTNASHDERRILECGCSWKAWQWLLSQSLPHSPRFYSFLIYGDSVKWHIQSVDVNERYGFSRQCFQGECRPGRGSISVWLRVHDLQLSFQYVAFGWEKTPFLALE
jgi:hypothetical protein